MKIEDAQVRGWHLADHGRRMVRTYRFTDVRETLAFVREIGEVAQREGRRPGISFGWRYVTVSFPARTVKGARAADIVTAKIDQVASEMTSRASA